MIMIARLRDYDQANFSLTIHLICNGGGGGGGGATLAAVYVNK